MNPPTCKPRPDFDVPIHFPFALREKNKSRFCKCTNGVKENRIIYKGRCDKSVENVKNSQDLLFSRLLYT